MARGDTSAASLAPGFRFHPTDEELVRYYLKRKVTNKPFRFDAIADVDIYKTEPWDLPGKSKLKTRDLEWYFFSMLDRKYGNGSKTNRATEKGYWKTTGKDRPIRWNSRNVGMKKTLVYHLGRAPRGERTNWVMHEYRLTDEDLEKAGVVQDAFVLCRIFQKSGTGPKNGEQYGAPFIEEEWDNDDELDLLPGEEMVVSDEVAVGDDAYAEQNELDQNFEFALASKNAPDNYYYGESSNFVEQSRNFSKDQKPLTERETSYFVEQSGNFSEDQKPMIERGASYFVEQCGNFSEDQKPITVKETSDFVDQSGNLSRDQKPIIERETSNFEEQSANFNGDQMPGTETEVQYCSDLPDGKVLFRLPNQCKVDEKPVRREFIAESSTNIDAIDSNYLLEEPFLDAIENPPLDEGFFLEDNDLSNPVEPDSIRGPTEFDMVDEYLSYFDPDNLTFDPSELIGSDDVAFDEAPLSKEDLRGGTEEVPKEKELYQTVNNTDASSSNPEKPVLTKLQPDVKYPFMKQASQLLGNIPAPPAFASEFPLKGMQLNAAPSSSSIRVTAGMIRIENVTFGGNGMDWSFGKNGNVNIVLSFTMPAGSASPASLDPVGNSFSDKTMSGVSRSWFFFMFFWVLILSISFKMGTYICAN